MNRTISTERYYTATEHLLIVFDQSARKLALNAQNEQEFQEWKQRTRLKLRDITGIDYMKNCDLQPRQLENEQLVGFRREKWLIQTEPDVWMPFYILIPDSAASGTQMPCMLALHGHSSAGKYAVAGRTDIPAVKDMIENYNYDYGVKLAEQGYVVFCPDARAFGERREWTKHSEEEDDFLTSTCIQLNHMAICLGQSVTGMWTWDLMRLVDYIESRNDCDAGRIGCAGLSGGGLQTLWLAAMDDRIKCSIVSGYFYGYKDSLLRASGNCGCNYVPNLWLNVDMGDIGALVAPRSLLVETGHIDHLNGVRGLDNVKEQVEITQSAYRLFGKEERLVHDIVEGGHVWYGNQCADFLKRWL